MHKYLGTIVMGLLLWGCNVDSEPSEGVYIIDDIAIVFDNDSNNEDAKERRSLQDFISNSIKLLKDDMYFNYAPTQMDVYTAEGKHTAELKQGRMQINEVEHTLIAKGKDHLRLVSDKKLACGFYDCEITLTLKKAEENNPALLSMKQQFAEVQEANKTQLMQERETMAHSPQVDFPGVLFSPAEHVAIKLPLNISDELKALDDGNYVRRLDNVVIDRKQEGTSVYYYRGSHDIRLDLIVVRAKKSDFDLMSWLRANSDVLAQSDTGAVYYNQDGTLEALYFQYDDVTQRYFFAVANASELTSMVTLVNILRTMDASQRGEYLSITDLALSRQALEEKTHLKMDETLDKEKIHQAIWSEIDFILQKPQRFIAQSQLLRPVRISVPSKTFRPDIYLSLSSRPLAQLMAEAEKDHPQGKRLDDVFIYETGSEEAYRYYVAAGDGLTLQLAVPVDVGNLAEQLMLLHVFRQLDVTRIPAIPAAERGNLFKYDSTGFKYSSPEDRFLVIGEKLVDLLGNLIIEPPEGSIFEFEPSPPFIVAQRWQDAGNGNAYRQADSIIFDEKGKEILHAASLDHIAGQRWAISGEGKTLGIYDLIAQKWIVLPKYDTLRWLDGVFMATNVSEEGHTSSQCVLLTTDGRVLADGNRIDEVEDKDRIIVIGNKNNVSLFNKKGALLFTRSGSELIYVPEIDSYGVLDLDPVSKQKRAGIVSERGEIIFPVVYRGFVAEDDLLEMQLPDGQPSRFYATEAVKNWRHHSPLQDVAVPQ